MPNRVPNRARYLTATGFGTSLFGYAMVIGKSNGIVATYSWMPDWFNHNELGIMWLLAGLVAMAVGILRMKFRGRVPDRWETYAFTGLVVPLTASLLLAVAGVGYSGSLSPSVIASNLQFLTATILAAGWADPRKGLSASDRIPPPWVLYPKAFGRAEKQRD